MKTKDIFLMILASGIFIAFIIYTVRVLNKVPYQPDEVRAYIIMEKFVDAQLKSPATAEYESISTIGIKQEGNVWAFDGYVDAQNGFGALLRNKFTVAIRYNPETKDWSLLNLVFNQ